MANIKIQNYLIESLKHNNDHYKNVINACHPYPCGICQKNVNNNQKAIECSLCLHWIHIKCNGTTNEEYSEIMKFNSSLSDDEIKAKSWFCNKCQISNMAQLFPFGFENNHDLQNILNCESLKFLDSLPSYEITSKAYDIDSLNQFDIDENIINNINSRYFSAFEFKNIKKSHSFNILHSNLNGLENKFEEYHNFINSIEMDIDILCISETSQKEKSNFSTNITIDGYKQPFHLGSMTSKGGVAIYAKNQLNVMERTDLNLINKSFEAVWIEIKNDKYKNIVCGCIYRHPSSDVVDFNNYLSKCLTKINKEKRNVICQVILILTF